MTSDSYVDFFIELGSEFKAANEITVALPKELRCVFWDNTQPIALPNGNNFFHVRMSKKHFDEIKGHPLIYKNIIGFDWSELWSRPYEFRDHIFFTIVLRKLRGSNSEPRFARFRISLSDLKESDEVIEKLARPQTLFAGDKVPSFPI